MITARREVGKLIHPDGTDIRTLFLNTHHPRSRDGLGVLEFTEGTVYSGSHLQMDRMQGYRIEGDIAAIAGATGIPMESLA